MLDRGRLEQVGTPDEVQDSPASATVLRFLGDAVEVEAIADGGRVLVNGRETPVPAPEGLIGPVKLYARPWHIQLAPTETAHLHGTVRASYRTHGRQRIEVEQPGGKLMTVETSDHAHVAPGREVGLRIVQGYVIP